jgi:glyoxylase-like metal-dependent hydrolase (beta-lactamase superfamily II)
VSRLRLTSLAGNTMKLDGGAMFGNAPKALWSRWMPADGRNMIGITTQALLVRIQDHVLLFETGAGAFLSPDMRARFQVREDRHVLLDSLAAQGLCHEDITHVILSHLHFDHSGGLLSAWTPESKRLELLFPNAEFIIGKAQFDRAACPHPRDRASFIPELPGLLKRSGRLALKSAGDCLDLGDMTVEFEQSQGHTPGMLVSWIRTSDQTLVFTADLIPARPWISQAITMGYDRFPEGLVDEKTQFLTRALAEEALLVFPHDDTPCTLARDEKTGRIIAGTPFPGLDMAV